MTFLIAVLMMMPVAAADPGADLEVWANPPQRHAKVGANVVTQITIRNDGPETAHDITLFVNISDQLDPVSLECPDLSGNLRFCTIDELAPGKRITLKYVSRVCCFPPGESPTAWVNPFIISSSPVDPDPSNNVFSAYVHLLR